MKATHKEILHFSSISELMERLEKPKAFHPLIAIVNYKEEKINIENAGKTFILDFYKISFKYTFHGKVKYGQGYYDFEEGGMAFLAPRQVVVMSAEKESYDGYALYFHPDLIRNYPLGKTISKYGFFSYAVSEALYLSDEEKQPIAFLFEAITHELAPNIEDRSRDVIVSQIELLLNYSNRFYNRQFITRKSIYNDLIEKMESYLSTRIENAFSTGLPTVKEVSDYFEVSPRYLTDMLKSLTGNSTQQHIHNKLIAKAQLMLSTTKLTVAEIAYQLGFEHPQSFSKIFKQKTNLSPIAYRQSFD